MLILIDLPKTDRLESCLCHRDLYRSTNAQHSLYSINLIQLEKNVTSLTVGRAIKEAYDHTQNPK